MPTEQCFSLQKTFKHARKTRKKMDGEMKTVRGAVLTEENGADRMNTRSTRIAASSIASIYSESRNF